MPIEFVVEDGTSKSDATSYATLDQYRQYWLNRGTDYTAVADDTIKAYLNCATEYIDLSYNFRGTKTLDTQALEWPRYNVEKDSSVQDYAYNNYYASDEIPVLIVNATCYIASKVSSGELNETIDNIRSETAGPVSVTYSGNSSKRYKAIDKMLKDLIIIGNKLVRIN